MIIRSHRLSRCTLIVLTCTQRFNYSPHVDLSAEGTFALERIPRNYFYHNTDVKFSASCEELAYAHLTAVDRLTLFETDAKFKHGARERKVLTFLNRNPAQIHRMRENWFSE